MRYHDGSSSILQVGTADELACRVVEVLGNKVLHICVDGRIIGNTKEFASVLLRNCTGVKALGIQHTTLDGDFVPFLALLISTYAPSLTEFMYFDNRKGETEINRRASAREITQMFLEAGELSLQCLLVESRFLHLFVRLFYAARNTLESINLGTDRDSGQIDFLIVIRMLTTHCHRLSRVMVPMNLYGNAAHALANLYVARGEQLTRISMPFCMRTQDCKRVALACPNVECNYGVIDSLVGGLSILYGIVTDLKVLGVHGGDWSELPQALTKCSGLRRLQVLVTGQEPLDVGMVSKLFEASLKNVELLVLGFIWPREVSLDSIAQVTKALKTIQLVVQDVGGDSMFEKIVEANPDLEVALVTEMRLDNPNRDAQASLNIVKDIVMCFSKCRQLKRLELEIFGEGPSHKQLSDECNVLRGSHVELSVKFMLFREQ